MTTPVIILIVVFAIAIVAFIVLAILGKKLKDKQDASQEQIRAAAQMVSMLVIDKKRMKLKDADFPKMVLEQTPKYLRGSKVPVVKAKIGPRVASLMCDEKAFQLIPVKKEVKVLLSGIYIMEVKSARGGLEKPKTKQELKAEAKAKKKAEAQAKKNGNKKAAVSQTASGKKKK